MDAREVLLVYAGANAISGAVQSTEGGALPEGYISAKSAGLHTADAPIDTEGRFRIDVPCSGDYDLFATVEGFLQDESVAVTVMRGEHIEGVVVPLTPASSISGRVLWNDGTPAAGCRVSVGLFAKPTDPSTRNRDGYFMSRQHMRHGSRSAADGAFRLGTLADGYAYEVTARSEDDTVRATCAGVLAGTTDVLIVLDRAGERRRSLLACVRDKESGAPIPSYTVSWSESPYLLHALASSTRRAVADPTGCVRIEDLPQREHWLLVQSAGRPTTRHGPVTPSEGVDRVEVDVGRLGSLVVGVRDEHGAAALYADVRTQAIDDRSRFAFPDSLPLSANTGTSGLVRFDDVSPGAYRIEASHGWHLSEQIDAEVASGRETTVTLSMATSVEGGFIGVSAEDARGAPIPGVLVQASSEPLVYPRGGRPASGLTDAAGQVMLGPLPPGTYTVSGTNIIGLQRASVGVTRTGTVHVRLRP
jgi:hypothetical protein